LEIVADAVGNYSVAFTADNVLAPTSGRAYMVMEDGYELPIPGFNMEVTVENASYGHTAWIWGGFRAHYDDPVVGEVVPAGVHAFRVKLTGATNLVFSTPVPGRGVASVDAPVTPFEKVEYKEGKIILQEVSTALVASLNGGEVYRVEKFSQYSQSEWGITPPSYVYGPEVRVGVCWWGVYPEVKCETRLVSIPKIN
jgi:hypothetical protein